MTNTSRPVSVRSENAGTKKLCFIMSKFFFIKISSFLLCYVFIYRYNQCVFFLSSKAISMNHYVHLSCLYVSSTEVNSEIQHEQKIVYIFHFYYFLAHILCLHVLPRFNILRRFFLAFA